MSLAYGLIVVLAMFCVAHAALTWGILRRLRGDLTMSSANEVSSPQPGTALEIDRAVESWLPPEFEDLVDDACLVAALSDGCEACQELVKALGRERAIPLPLVAVVESEATAEAVRGATAAMESPLVIAVCPDDISESRAIGRPYSFPSVMLVRRRVVLYSDFRLRSVISRAESMTSTFG